MRNFLKTNVFRRFQIDKFLILQYFNKFFIWKCPFLIWMIWRECLKKLTRTTTEFYNEVVSKINVKIMVISHYRDAFFNEIASSNLYFNRRLPIKNWIRGLWFLHITKRVFDNRNGPCTISNPHRAFFKESSKMCEKNNLSWNNLNTPLLVPKLDQFFDELTYRLAIKKEIL